MPSHLEGLGIWLSVWRFLLTHWAGSGGSGETARMRRLAWTFAARIGDNYQIRLTRPICLVPKKQPGEYRMIHHLSYPEGESINDCIDPTICSVQYTKFDDAVKMIQNLGKGILLGKADVKSAFRLMIISPDDFPLLGSLLLWPLFAVWTCLFVCFVGDYVVRQSCSVGELEHYLDDFLFGSKAGIYECNMCKNGRWTNWRVSNCDRFLRTRMSVATRCFFRVRIFVSSQY